ncbi:MULTISPECIES: hypothetical protein [unclassified Actinotalea]|nr:MULTISPECIES: hypothetical protein [unclassified Actinotalea]
MSLADIARRATSTPPERREGGQQAGASQSPIYDELIAERGDPTSKS